MLPGGGDATAAGCAAIAATEARVGIATDPPTVAMRRRDRRHARHRRPRSAIRSAAVAPAQRQLVVADLDLVAFAQRRRRRDLRAVDADAGEAGEILDVERAVLAESRACLRDTLRSVSRMVLPSRRPIGHLVPRERDDRGLTLIVFDASA